MTEEILPTDEYEHELLYDFNKSITNALKYQDWAELLSTASFLRNYHWQRKEYLEAACRMADNAHALVRDLDDFRTWLNRRGEAIQLAWKWRRMARGWKHRPKMRRALLETVESLWQEWRIS